MNSNHLLFCMPDIFTWIPENVNYALLSLCRLLDFVLEHTLCISTEVLFFQDFHSSFVMTSLRSFYSEYNLVSLLRPGPSSNSVFLILKGLTSSDGRERLVISLCELQELCNLLLHSNCLCDPSFTSRMGCTRKRL